MAIFNSRESKACQHFTHFKLDCARELGREGGGKITRKDGRCERNGEEDDSVGSSEREIRARFEKDADFFMTLIFR